MILKESRTKMLTSFWLTVVFAFISPALAAPASLWHIEIFKGPAPPPEEGPPGAVNALRDPSKLKYEIIGIVGAYVVWIVVTILLLLFVGLKLRRRAQSSNPTLSMEIIKTPKYSEKELPPGPLSPGKMASLKSWAMGSKHKHSKSNATNATESTIDTRIVEEDRARNMDEMAMLYASVMAHDEERASSGTDSSPSSPHHYRTDFKAASQSIPTPPKSPQHPPELQHLRQQPPHPSEAPYYYPPPVPADNISRATTRVNESPRAFTPRHERNPSSNSTKSRPGRISVRGLPISEPTGPANLADSVADNGTTTTSYAPSSVPPTPRGLPMSPRLYNIESARPLPDYSRSTTAQSREAEGPRKRATPAAIDVQAQDNNGSNTNLPFRQMYQGGLTSAPPTKTTFLERKSILGHHPKTGVPQTPYSPYMPMTPMTPVTPSRLFNKKDMKKQKKADGLKVLSEDDMVKGDDDMWGS